MRESFQERCIDGDGGVARLVRERRRGLGTGEPVAVENTIRRASRRLARLRQGVGERIRGQKEGHYFAHQYSDAKEEIHDGGNHCGSR